MFGCLIFTHNNNNSRWTPTHPLLQKHQSSQVKEVTHIHTHTLVTWKHTLYSLGGEDVWRKTKARYSKRLISLLVVGGVVMSSYTFYYVELLILYFVLTDEDKSMVMWRGGHET